MTWRHGVPRRRDRRAGRVRNAVFATLGFLALAPAHAYAEPANTIQEMWRRFQACIDKMPGGYGSKDSQITIVFALKRDGSLLGRPRITYSKLLGDLDEQKRFVASAIASIGSCLPLDITPALGGAIAGRQLALRIVNGRPQIDI